jgi:hypothetical protein
MINCYSLIASNKKDPSICENIADQSKKDLCIRRASGEGSGFLKGFTESTPPQE